MTLARPRAALLVGLLLAPVLLAGCALQPPAPADEANDVSSPTGASDAPCQGPGCPGAATATCRTDDAYEGWEMGTRGWDVIGARHVMQVYGCAGRALRLDPGCCGAFEHAVVSKAVRINLTGNATFGFHFRGVAIVGDTDAFFELSLDDGRRVHVQVSEGVQRNTGVSVWTDEGGSHASFANWTEPGAWHRGVLQVDGPARLVRATLHDAQGREMGASRWISMGGEPVAITSLHLRAVAWSESRSPFEFDTLTLRESAAGA